MLGLRSCRGGDGEPEDELFLRPRCHAVPPSKMKYSAAVTYAKSSRNGWMTPTEVGLHAAFRRNGQVRLR